MFWDAFYDLCKKKNKTPNGVAKDLGIASGSITLWKNTKSMPRSNTIKKIADYFGVNVDYFYNETPERPRKGEIIFLPESNAYLVPLFESVSAGFGAYPDDKIIGYELCSIESKEEAEETLCIRVSGDSMYPKIENSDIIQVHKQESVDSGKIAVVLVDGEDALVKKVVYGSDWIELRSFNPMYPPRRFDGEAVLRVRVLGQVRKVIKNL